MFQREEEFGPDPVGVGVSVDVKPFECLPDVRLAGHPEHRAVDLADAHVHGDGGGWDEPPVEARAGHGGGA